VEVGAIQAVFETNSELLSIAMNQRGHEFSRLEASIDDLKIQLHSLFSRSKVRACVLAYLGKFCNAHEVSV
jgi:hypothetical protein